MGAPGVRMVSILIDTIGYADSVIDAQVEWMTAMRCSLKSRIFLLTPQKLPSGIGVRGHYVVDGDAPWLTEWRIVMPATSLIPEETLEWCIRSSLNPRKLYKFSRYLAPDMVKQPPDRKTFLAHSSNTNRRFEEAPVPVISLC